MFDLMQIAGFPVEIEHGLFTWSDRELIGAVRMNRYAGQSGVHSTSDFEKVIKMFDWWKERTHDKN